jgi:hypothetical protein
VSDDAPFSEADLQPTPEERRANFCILLDRGAAALAALAAGVWAGGMVALGACAAPFVFALTPAPFSGDAMGAAFARFDGIALGAAVLVLGAEVARTWVAGTRGRSLFARARRIAAIAAAVAAAHVGLSLTPAILELHQAGVRRGVGAEGARLDEIHRRAEALGKVEVALAAALVVLHVLTLPARRPEDDDDAPAPLPPGPFGARAGDPPG